MRRATRALACALTFFLGIGTLKAQTSTTIAYKGESARQIFATLSDNLLLPPTTIEGVGTLLKKVGYAMSCEMLVFDEPGRATEAICSQLFFAGNFTSNPERITDIPAASPTDPESYIEIQLRGPDAAAIFQAAAEKFPDDLRNCRPGRVCSYVRIVRAQDITCYEELDAAKQKVYRCWQYIQTAEGFAVAGGSDPMIGVVLNL